MFMLPTRIKSQLKDVIIENDSFDSYEDILEGIIKKSEASQAAYNGYSRLTLNELAEKSNLKVVRFKSVTKSLEVMLGINLCTMMIYNIMFSQGFDFQVLCVEWFLFISLAIILYFYHKRLDFWSYQQLILKQCIEKCKGDEVFHFDDEF